MTAQAAENVRPLSLLPKTSSPLIEELREKFGQAIVSGDADAAERARRELDVALNGGLAMHHVPVLSIVSSPSLAPEPKGDLA